MLVQGKEKRAVFATHEPLVDADTFETIQKSFQAKAFHLTPSNQSSENILKGKVICGCCGGKMQRKRGSNHTDWYFFTCITKNRLGGDRCTGMYVRGEDVFSAIYHQLKLYVKDHFIPVLQYAQEIRIFDHQIDQAAQHYNEALQNGMRHYEGFVEGKISREEFRVAQDAANEARVATEESGAAKEAYEKRYQVLCKLMSASYKETALCEIIPYIERIVRRLW